HLPDVHSSAATPSQFSSCERPPRDQGRLRGDEPGTNHRRADRGVRSRPGDGTGSIPTPRQLRTGRKENRHTQGDGVLAGGRKVTISACRSLLPFYGPYKLPRPPPVAGGFKSHGGSIASMLQAGEILVILLVALIVLGPTRLPEAARKIGSWAAELRKAAREITQGLEAEVAEVRKAAEEVKQLQAELKQDL